MPIEDVAGAVKELIQARQGQAFRPVRSRRADDPARPRRPAGHGAAERIFAVVAQAGSRSAAAARGTRHRPCAVQPAGQGLPDRQDRRQHAIRQHGFPQHRCRASRRRRGRPTRRSSNLCELAKRKKARRRRSRWPGCWRRSRGSCRSPARRSCTGWRRISARPLELTPDDLREIESAAAKIAIQGDSIPGGYGAIGRTLTERTRSRQNGRSGRRRKIEVQEVVSCNASRPSSTKTSRAASSPELDRAKPAKRSARVRKASASDRT